MILLSPSQISSLFGQWACPASYYWSYVNMQRRKPKAVFDIGKGIENCITNYHKTGEMKTDIFSRTIQDLAKHTIELPAEELEEYKNEIYKTEEILSNLLLAYKADVPQLELIDTQTKLEMTINKDVSMIGYLDFVVKGEKKPKIIDVKSAGRSWSEHDLKTKIQDHIYPMMAEDSLGVLADFEYHVLVKTKTPKIQIIEIEVTRERVDQLKNLIIQAAKAKEEFSFIPCERDKTHCSVCGKDHTLEFYFD